MAARKPVVENAARQAVEVVYAGAEVKSFAAGRLRATRIVKGFADAIVRLLVGISWWRAINKELSTSISLERTSLDSTTI